MSTAATPRPHLFGREAELARIDAELTGAASTGTALLIVGAPGVGKTALLDTAAAEAADRGMAVLRATAVQAETLLPFASLHQLLRPLASRVRRLAARQRDVIRAAFGEVEGVGHNAFLVAMATLNLLTDAAANAPLLLAVDDAQWSDAPSVQVLAFVARRLRDTPVLLAVGLREGYPSALHDAGLPTLTVPELDEAASERLLAARHRHLDQRGRARVARLAGGNPLALVELPLNADVRSDAPTGAVPLTARLEQSFAARLAELRPEARAVLIIAAANDSGDVDETLAAAAPRAGAVTVDVLDEGVMAGLVAVTDRTLAFRHPLVRSAIYQAAGAAERRAAHAGLGAVLVDQPERRAWHRAAASSRPDEDVAAELEAVGRAAERRGAGEISAAAWQRAAALSPDPARRGARLLRAAELSAELGELERATGLARQAQELLPGLRERARAALVLDSVRRAPGDATQIRLLADLARQVMTAGDGDLAARLLLHAARHSWSADPGPEARRDLLAATEQLPLPADDPRRLSILGFAAPGEHGGRIAERVARIAPDELDPLTEQLAMSVFLVGADPAITTLQAHVVDRVRARGQLAALPQVLTQQAWNAIALADWRAAVPLVDEAARLALEMRQPLWEAAAHTGGAMVACLRGAAAEAELLAAKAESIVLPMRISAVLCGIGLVRGVTALAAGRYDQAYRHLERLFDPADPAFQPVQSTWALGDLAEAAAHTGRRAHVRPLVDRYGPAAVGTSPWGRTAAAYARPLVTDDAEAEAAFDRALGSELRTWPAYHARLTLEYGMWLRRQRRVADSRAPLRAARDACDALGLKPWSDRARQELRATGEAASELQRRPEPWTALSPQEIQIALLAVEGLSNRDIAQRLYLSHRTVGTHLYRIFPKLGISSRAQLGAALAARPTAPAAPAPSPDRTPVVGSGQ